MAKYDEWLAIGMCGFCGIEPLVNRTECENCRNKRRLRQKSAYRNDERLKKHQKTWEERHADGKCIRCNEVNDNGKKNCDKCLNKHRDRENKVKDKVYERYGGYSCFCCGETIKEFLTLDHKNNDGSKHRRELGSAVVNLYRWITKNDFPPLFQVACYNCNSGRHRNGGVCPHQRRV